MLAKAKINLISKRSLSVGFGFVLFALIVGIYFLFRPFPAGPTLDVKANSPSIASVTNFDGYVRAPSAAKTGAFFSDKYAYIRAPGAKKAVANAPGALGNGEAATVNRWYEYANPPAEVKTNDIQLPNVEAATVNRWYEYANPPSELRTNPVQLPQVAAAPNQKVSPGQGSSKGFLAGGELLQPNASAAQKLDIGGGYVLENSALGSKIVSPSFLMASQSASADASVQRFDIGTGYVLELNQAGGRIITSANAYSASAAQESSIPSFTLDVMSEDQRSFAPANTDKVSAAQEPSIPSFTLDVMTEDQRNFVPGASVQRLDVGGGYMLEMSAQGYRIVASVAHPQAIVPRFSTDFVQRIDLGGGYVLEMGSLSSRIIAPVTLQPQAKAALP